MKRTITLISLIFAVLFLSTNLQAKEKNRPEATIEEQTFDFGTIKASDKNVSHVFTISNTGTAPLVIISANASCGCTRPTYTAEPIAPGKKGEVKVTFVPAGQRGDINKEVKIRTNAPGAKRITLRITGKVIP